MERNSTKRPYRKLDVEDWGTVTDLTATGRTFPGADDKAGSVATPGT